MEASVKKSIVAVVDVGNSQTVVGLYRGNTVVEYWRLTTRKQTTSDEVLIRIDGLIRHSQIKPEDITHVGLSTVVPVLERPWVKALEFLIRKPVQIVNHLNCLELPIAYPAPNLAGPDRLCNIIAMRSLGYTNGVVVDMGTATTFDVMRHGGFAGGPIVPGINAALDVLTDKTARLLPVTLEWTDHLVCDNTDDALRAGLLYGFVGQLEYLLHGIKKELGNDSIPIIATGGWGKMIAQKTKLFTRYDPYLTLEGIRLVALSGNGTLNGYQDNEVDE